MKKQRSSEVHQDWRFQRPYQEKSGLRPFRMRAHLRRTRYVPSQVRIYLRGNRYLSKLQRPRWVQELKVPGNPMGNRRHSTRLLYRAVIAIQASWRSASSVPADMKFASTCPSGSSAVTVFPVMAVCASFAKTDVRSNRLEKNNPERCPRRFDNATHWIASEIEVRTGYCCHLGP